MNAWAFEIIDKETNQVLYFDTGYDSESEAEYCADMDARLHNYKNYYIRTYPV